jgi:hypothetical protein
MDAALKAFDETLLPRAVDISRVGSELADSEGWRSGFRSDVDHDSEVMPISVPN